MIERKWHGVGGVGYGAKRKLSTFYAWCVAREATDVVNVTCVVFCATSLASPFSFAAFCDVFPNRMSSCFIASLCFERWHDAGGL
jgi:hypothetical protein